MMHFNLKTTFHINPKTKLLKNILLVKYLISIAMALKFTSAKNDNF